MRKRVTPSRHDVVDEEVDKELLLNARDTDGFGREFPGLSAELRDFLKIRTAPQPRKKRGIAWRK